MKGQKPFEVYTQVADGSTLEASISGDVDTVNADAQLVSITHVLRFERDDLVPGPVREVLRSDSDYFLRIRLIFVQDGAVEILTRILKPNGDVHSDPTRWTVNGETGETVIRGIFIQTK